MTKLLVFGVNALAGQRKEKKKACHARVVAWPGGETPNREDVFYLYFFFWGGVLKRLAI